MAQHADELPTHTCPNCEMRFEVNDMLENHLKQAHQIDVAEHPESAAGSTQLRCMKCPFTPQDRNELREHLSEVHSKEGVHVCETCGRTYYRLHAYNMHVATHAALKYTCKHCSDAFSNPHLLKVHSDRQHGRERKYKCEQCSYSAIQHSHLVDHMRRKHSLEKPYVCDQCDYRGASSSNLKDHQRRHHTMEKPYKCPVCGHASVTNSNIRDHLRRRHPGSGWEEMPIKVEGSEFPKLELPGVTPPLLQPSAGETSTAEHPDVDILAQALSGHIGDYSLPPVPFPRMMDFSLPTLINEPLVSANSQSRDALGEYLKQIRKPNQPLAMPESGVQDELDNWEGQEEKD